MTKQKVPVTVDTREDNDVAEEIGGLYLRHEDVADIEFEELSSGDVNIAGVGFERKTPSDFASSVLEGRLKDQARRISEEYEHAYILVEGSIVDFDHLEHTDIPSKSLRGAAASVTARYCPVLFVGDYLNGEHEDREYLVDYSMRISRKHVEEEGRHFVKGSVTDTSLSATERVSGSLEGVGPELARRIASNTNSVANLVDMNEAELKEIDGIGDELARSIRKELHGLSE